jgi:hypothetical protein
MCRDVAFKGLEIVERIPSVRSCVLEALNLGIRAVHCQPPLMPIYRLGANCHRRLWQSPSTCHAITLTVQPFGQSHQECLPIRDRRGVSHPRPSGSVPPATVGECPTRDRRGVSHPRPPGSVPPATRRGVSHQRCGGSIHQWGGPPALPVLQRRLPAQIGLAF